MSLSIDCVDCNNFLGGLVNIVSISRPNVDKNSTCCNCDFEFGFVRLLLVVVDSMNSSKLTSS